MGEEGRPSREYTIGNRTEKERASERMSFHSATEVD